MLYYRVPKKMDGVTIATRASKGMSLINGELFTGKELERKFGTRTEDLKRYLEPINIKQSDTFTNFGIRFEIKK